LLDRALAARGVSVCFLIVAATFVVSTIYSRSLATRIDGYARSIAYNGVPGVVDLGTVADDLRQITARAMRARPASLAADRAAIAAWLADVDASLSDYERTEDYPGEHALDIAAERARGPFVDALDGALSTVDGPEALRGPALERLTVNADALAGRILDLMRLNATHVTRESVAITDERKFASAWLQALRALALVVATGGMVLASSARRQQVALIESNQRMAEERASELELFAGRVAHDLRAPLTVIAVRSSMGAQTSQIDVLKGTLEKIQKQGERMGDIIDALLAFARAGARPEAGRCDDVAREIALAVAECQPAAASAKVELVIEPLPALSIACPATVLSIVLSNLVRNGIKYMGTGRGGLRRITVRGRTRTARLRVEVQDTGPGLPHGTERMVFEPFVRVAPEVRDGIGLGLATVKRLVEAHGGAVGVESDPERGCCFWFELPLLPAAHACATRSGADLPSARQRAMALPGPRPSC